MKALSIKQPYAGFIADGAKSLEVRNRKTNYRGDFLICVSKSSWSTIGFDKETAEYYKKQQGKAIAVASLTDCRFMTPQDEKEACYPFSAGSYVWQLENIRIIKPFNVCANLGFFNIKNECIKF